MFFSLSFFCMKGFCIAATFASSAQLLYGHFKRGRLRTSPNYQNNTQFIKLFRNIRSYSVTAPVVFSILPIGVYSEK